jgi:hypothetical protein
MAMFQIILLMLSGILIAAPANFLLTDGTKRFAEFIEIKSDSVYLTVKGSNDQLSNRVFHKSHFSKIVLTSGEYVDLALSNYAPGQSKPAIADDWGDQTSGTATEKDLPVVAVSDFDGYGMDKATMASLTDRFRSFLLATGKFRVMERNQMQLILQEQGFQMSGACNEASCLVEMGQLIAVQKMLTGSLGKVGGIYTVTVKMIDVASGNIDKNISEDCDCPIEGVLTQTLDHLARKVAGLSVAVSGGVSFTKGDAGLFVKTNVPTARVYLDGKLQDGATPLTIENQIAGKHMVEVKKTIDGVIYSAKQDVVLLANQVARMELKLEKAKTILKLHSVPSEAELYVDNSKNLGRSSLWTTPALVYDIASGNRKLTLFKPGYRDTTIDYAVREFEINELSVNLVPESDETVLASQKHFVRHRTYRKIGRWTIGVSLGLGAAGGALLYLADKDKKDADDSKAKLEAASIRTGSEYQKLLDENKKSSDDYKLKSTFGTALLGMSATGMVVGVILWF